jgi:hypothetical protein
MLHLMRVKKEGPLLNTGVTDRSLSWAARRLAPHLEIGEVNESLAYYSR